jgi:Domain of unknown function (DUF4780)
VTCVDDVSARWLTGAVPNLRPWENASLKAMEGEDIPKPCACVVYIPHEDGRKLEAAKILTRLRVSNRGLKTSLWTVWGSTPDDKGTLWTFSMDKKSKEEIQKLEMRPYFGMGRVRFRLKEGPVEKASEAATKGSKPQGISKAKGKPKIGSDKKDKPPKVGISPLKRTEVQELVVPMEEDKVEEPINEESSSTT